MTVGLAEGDERAYAELYDRLAGRLYQTALGMLMQNVATADARRGTARLGLALFRFRAQHGRFPEKLGDVAPEFIAVVPSDPFDGKPLRVKQTAHSATVYSIGPEMTDSQGMPLFDIDKKHRDIWFTVPDEGSARK